jgi:hypothetical protein
LALVLLFFAMPCSKQPFAILSDAHSRLLFIGIGVAFLATLGDEQPLRPF